MNYRDVDGINFAVVVIVLVVVIVVVVAAAVLAFNGILDWLGCFFGLAGGVLFGDLLDRPLIERLEPRLLADNLLIAPVFACTGTDAAWIAGGSWPAVKLFCRGGAQPK